MNSRFPGLVAVAAAGLASVATSAPPSRGVGHLDGKPFTLDAQQRTVTRRVELAPVERTGDVQGYDLSVTAHYTAPHPWDCCDSFDGGAYHQIPHVKVTVATEPRPGTDSRAIVLDSYLPGQTDESAPRLRADALDRSGKAAFTATFERLDPQEFGSVSVQWEVGAQIVPDDSVSWDGGVAVEELQ